MAFELVAAAISHQYGPLPVLEDISFTVRQGEIIAVVGPSGCGKSTVLRCVNRMHEVVPRARHEGNIFLGRDEIYAPGADPVAVRRRVGMVFQRPNPFPTMSVYDNVVSGLRLNGVRSKKVLDEVAERSLRHAGLWEELDGRLDTGGARLSGGQQQRLCIARALANDPEVLLLDEPASALDPISTQRIEELLYELKRELTVVIVTHNLQQAARVSDFTGFFYLGHLVELDVTDRIFTSPREARTEAYVTGRFG
jgi:phosphate transport system ATP-binding protein